MRRQRGYAQLIIIGIVVVIVVAVVLGALHAYNKAIEEKVAATQRAEVAESVASKQRDENNKLKVANELLSKQTAARKASDLKKADVERIVNNAIQSVYAKNPEARKWADTPVPADILSSMRSDQPNNVGSDKDGKGPTAPTVDLSNSRPKPALPTNEWGITRPVSPVGK